LRKSSVAVRRKHQASRACETSRRELKDEKTFGIDWAWHEELCAGKTREPDACIIGLVTHQQHEAVSLCFRAGQAFAHKRKADAKILPFGMNGEGAKQQGRRFACKDGPKRNATYKPEAVFARNERKAWNGLIAFAQAIGCLGAAGEAETQVEEMLDLCGVRQRFIGERVFECHGEKLSWLDVWRPRRPTHRVKAARIQAVANDLARRRCKVTGS
jgi:hypothetical protein